jgi:hypothetical protein
LKSYSSTIDNLSRQRYHSLRDDQDSTARDNCVECVTLKERIGPLHLRLIDDSGKPLLHYSFGKYDEVNEFDHRIRKIHHKKEADCNDVKMIFFLDPSQSIEVDSVEKEKDDTPCRHNFINCL